MPLIYLIAGEQSGDVLGARLMRAILRRSPDAAFAGIGGAAMEALGLTSLFPMGDLALMGLLEVLPKLRVLRARLAQTTADIAARKPDVVVTIDSPGFTLRVLRAIRPLGIPRVHYVAPQVWAWRENRVKNFPGLWEKLLCLLPFEAAFFARHGLPAQFIGHPILEIGCGKGDAARFRARHGIDPDARILIVMPGSRRTEVRRLLPILEATLDRLPEKMIPVIPLAGPVADFVTFHARAWKTLPVLIAGEQDKFDAFAAASAALTKSGTSSLELALAGVPMVVTYRLNPITHAIVKQMATVKYASLLNLLAGREIVPELLQYQGTPAKLAAALGRILTPEGAAEQRAAFAAPLALLRAPPDAPGEPSGVHGGEPSNLNTGEPSDAAAAAVLSLLKQPAALHPAA